MEQNCAVWITAVFVVVVMVLGFLLSVGGSNKKSKE